MTPHDREKKDNYRKYLREREYELVEEFNSACGVLRCALRVYVERLSSGLPHPVVFYRQQKYGCINHLRRARLLREKAHAEGRCVP